MRIRQGWMRPRTQGLGWATLAVALLAAVSLAATQRDPRRPPLPSLGRVASFSLQDQDGATVGRESLAGEPWVASFFFTRCPTVCPVLMGRMQELRRLAEERDTPLRLVSITVDPEHDRSAVLEVYGRSREVNWSMLTGSEEAVAALAESFAVALEGEADPEELNYGILHSGHLVLVDGAGTIRGYYPSGEQDIAKRILADSRRLDAAS